MADDIADELVQMDRHKPPGRAMLMTLPMSAGMGMGSECGMRGVRRTHCKQGNTRGRGEALMAARQQGRAADDLWVGWPEQLSHSPTPPLPTGFTCRNQPSGSGRAATIASITRRCNPSKSSHREIA